MTTAALDALNAGLDMLNQQSNVSPRFRSSATTFRMARCGKCGNEYDELTLTRCPECSHDKDAGLGLALLRQYGTKIPTTCLTCGNTTPALMSNEPPDSEVKRLGVLQFLRQYPRSKRAREITQAKWWHRQDSKVQAEFIQWLIANGEIGAVADEVIEVVSYPWLWSDEFDQFQDERRMQCEASAL